MAVTRDETGRQFCKLLLNKRVQTAALLVVKLLKVPCSSVGLKLLNYVQKCSISILLESAGEHGGGLHYLASAFLFLQCVVNGFS